MTPVQELHRDDATRKTSQTASAVELRLRLIIESAPVSIVLADAEGRLLAANRAALALLGVERLDQILGRTLDAHLAPAARGPFRALVEDVCRGNAGSLEYQIARPDGGRSTVVTHGVPLARDGVAPAAFLGATWDVSERERLGAALREAQEQVAGLEAQHAGERTRLEQGLSEARAECERLATRIRTEQQTIGDTLRETRNRMRAALIDAEAEHAEAANQWRLEREALTAERDALIAERDAMTADHEALRARAGRLEEEQAALAAELTLQREAAEARLEEAERVHRREYERFRQDIRDLEDQIRRAAEAQLAAQQELDRLRGAERLRIERAIDQRRQWQGKLAGLLGSLQAMSARVERLADEWSDAEGAGTEGAAFVTSEQAPALGADMLALEEVRLEDLRVQLTPVPESSAGAPVTPAFAEMPAGDPSVPPSVEIPSETSAEGTARETGGELQWGF